MAAPELRLVSGALGEPPLFDALILLEELKNTPKRGECGNAKDGGEDQVVGKKGEGTEEVAGQKEEPPALYSPIILGLDDDRMKNADDEKGGKPNDNTC